MYQYIVIILLLIFVGVMESRTDITVIDQYGKVELNIKISGTGVGGCDILLSNGETNTQDCWCLWGTLNYSFCAYDKTKALAINSTSSDPVNTHTANGRCAPSLTTGENLLCEDVASLGNCYDLKGYTCIVDSSGLCHCSSI